MTTLIRTMLTTWLLTAALLIAFCSNASAQTLHLTLGGSAVTFPSANPATTPSIPAQQNPVAITVSTTGLLGTWVVTVLALGDLISGTDSIPISNVHWTASGAAFLSGTISKLLPQNLGAGAFASTAATGTLNFYLDNSWNYATGSYSQGIVLTAVSL